jgi:SAM-dependent methyltransferase
LESVLARCRAVWDERADRSLLADLNDGYPENKYFGRYEDIRHKLSPNQSMSLLDVGCGRGAVLRNLTDKFDKVVGVDISSCNLDRLQQDLGPVEVHQASAHDLPFPDDSYDRVLLYGVLHYMPNWELASSVVRELIRVCKPGGIVLVGDNEPVLNTAFDPPIHKKPVNPSQSRPGDVELCFTNEFFEDILLADGHNVTFTETWEQPGHFDLLVEVKKKTKNA